MLKFLILLSVALLLQGCNTTAPLHTNRSSSKTLLNSTSQKLQRNYKLDYANLVIKYDLMELRKDNCLYAKDYGLIINDAEYNKAFLQKLKTSSSQNINAQAMKKANQIKTVLLKLNNKYKFLSQNELNTLKQSKKGIEHDTNELAKLDQLTSTIPIMSPEYNIKVTSKYGMRKHSRKKKAKFHCGLDIQGNKNAPIYAAADGVVTIVGREKAYGNLIAIKHSNHFTTKYAHLRKIYIKAGEVVSKGQMIGVQGNSGNSTGEHLHFEIWLRNNHVNPFDFLSHACNC